MLTRVSEAAALVLAALCLPSCIATSPAFDHATWPRHAEMGRCFADASSFIEIVAGPQGRYDENIRIRPASPLADGSVWVVDQTPQTNYQWYLLQPGEHVGLCLTLFVPAAAQVTLSATDESQTAYAKTQASPDFPVKEVRFVRMRRERVFHTVECAELRLSDATARRESVPCAGLFD